MEPCIPAGVGQTLHDGDIDFLAVKELADTDAVDGLRQVGVVVAVFVALILPCTALAGFDKNNDTDKDRQAGNYDQRQGCVGGEHEHHDENQVDDLQDHVDDTVGKNIRNGVDVVDNPDQDLAGRPGIVIAERQLLQVGKQVAADIMDDPLTDMGHHPGTDGGEDNAQGDDAHKEQGHAADHGGIFVRYRFIEHPLGDLGDKEGGNAGHGAEQQRGQHFVFMPGDVLTGTLQVLPPEGGFQTLVNVEFIARHPYTPSAETTAAPGTESVGSSCSVIGRPYWRQ